MGEYELEHTKKWSAVIKPLDGYVWVTPEYNHGYSAPLKNAIDTLYHEWSRKPVAFLGYGGLGGTRAIEQLITVAARIDMAPISAATLHVIDVWSAFDESGKLKPESVYGHVPKVVDKLNWWATTLKTARESQG
jgi:NAD(P)H-dependent FMN reductase